MKKKLIALALTMAVAAQASVVFAAEGVFNVDGKAVAATVNEGDKILVPVRAAAEALGYNVAWNGENKSVTLTQGAFSILFEVGKDGYCVAKTAPMPLGQAPVIIEGKAYVPIEVFSDLMELPLSIDGNEVNVITATEVKGTGVIGEVKNGSVMFMDDEKGEVMLNISEDTAITNSKGESIKADGLKEGELVEVIYGDAMMESYPPQNNPKSITVISKALESISMDGVVTEVGEDYIVVEGKGNEVAYPSVMLIITEETKGDGVAAKVGEKVSANFSPAMTRSLPPQSVCESIYLITE